MLISEIVNTQSLLEFLRQNPLAVQASVTSSGAPQAAVVAFAVTDQFELIFDTLDSTRKAQNLHLNSRIALVIGGCTPGSLQTLQLEGLADFPTGAELERLHQTYFAAFPDGTARLSWPGITYIRVRPTWARLSNYADTPPSIVEFSAQDFK